jgi:S-adenosylmethionine hydrolase
MADPLITLTTDFGAGSPYVAAMKGVILTINPAARIVDLSHEIPPQDVRHAAFFVAAALPYFPPDAIHMLVVDPGVGSERAALFVESGGMRLLAPDNGCWTLLTRERAAPRVIRLAEPRYWRTTVSATFHGRDVFAPVAAYLSLGIHPQELGPDETHWVELQWPFPLRMDGLLHGEVVFVDHFGNLITNLRGDDLPNEPHTPIRVSLNGQVVDRLVRTYSDGSPGEVVALVSSFGLLEVAEIQGNASARLQVSRGDLVRVEWK